MLFNHGELEAVRRRGRRLKLHSIIPEMVIHHTGNSSIHEKCESREKNSDGKFGEFDLGKLVNTRPSQQAI